MCSWRFVWWWLRTDPNTETATDSEKTLCSSSQNRSFPRSLKHFNMEQWKDVSVTLVPFYDQVYFSSPGCNSTVFPADSEENFFVIPKEKCSDCEQLKVFKEVLLSTEALKPKLDRCLKVSFFFSFYKDEPFRMDILSICPRLKTNYFLVLNSWARPPRFFSVC